jgi:hypothetical protein
MRNSTQRSPAGVPEAFNNVYWTDSIPRVLEFFPTFYTPVRLICVTDPAFSEILRDLDDGSRLALDIEWQPDESPTSAHLPSVFQIASSKGVLIIQHPVTEPASPVLREFLIQHLFYSKGMWMDRIKLGLRFGSNFPLHQFEDIEDSLLKPNRFSLNYQRMLADWAPTPTALFKDAQIQMSDWSSKSLTVAQVMYAAFDVVALRVVDYNIRMTLGYQMSLLAFNVSTSQSEPQAARRSRKSSSSPARERRRNNAHKSVAR